MFHAYIYNERGVIIADGKSRKRDKAIRIASGAAPKNQGEITLKVVRDAAS